MSDEEFRGSMAEITAHEESQRQPKYPNIKYVSDYSGHWSGEAWETGHRYGTQVHRSLGDAERWIEQRRTLNLEHPEDCVWCVAVVLESHEYQAPQPVENADSPEYAEECGEHPDTDDYQDYADEQADGFGNRYGWNDSETLQY